MPCLSNSFDDKIQANIYIVSHYLSLAFSDHVEKKEEEGALSKRQERKKEFHLVSLRSVQSTKN
jgi:hypothetical protein